MGTEMNELRLRVEAKKKELEAQIAKLKANSASGANGAVEKLQTKLNNLEGELKSGWESVSEGVASRLNRWLKD